MSKSNWQNRIVESGIEDASQLLANPFNARIHPQFQQQALEGVLDSVGWVQRVIVNKATGHVVDGHLRVALAITRGEPVPVDYVELTEAEEKLILASFDYITTMAVYDREQLDALLQEVNSDDARVQEMLAALAGVPELPVNGETTVNTEARPSLADRFIIPPFSVLDARQGYWQERKRQWLALGIQSELGRGGEHSVGQLPETASLKGGLTFGTSINPYNSTGKQRNSRYESDLRSNLNDAPALPTMATQTGTANMATGTSIFDPVFCELAYRWFTPPDGSILDPFAGGSVRGIVAHKLGRRYTGIDLRAEQVQANEAQARELCADTQPTWITGDSIRLDDLLAPDEYFDFVFSCPPYFDLEIYSDDPRDLSNADDYTLFRNTYRAIIAAAVSRLKNNRFACFVVGDIRDNKGMYRNFVSDTIAAFQDAGAMLYNEAILVTAVGSLPIRVGKQFESGRKLGKTHQNVLVFVKGDPRKAADACGIVTVHFPDENDSVDQHIQ